MEKKVCSSFKTFTSYDTDAILRKHTVKQPRILAQYLVRWMSEPVGQDLITSEFESRGKQIVTIIGCPHEWRIDVLFFHGHLELLQAVSAEIQKALLRNGDSCGKWRWTRSMNVSLGVTAGGSANLYSHFADQYGSFSENWKSTYLKTQQYHFWAYQEMHIHTTRALAALSVIADVDESISPNAQKPSLQGAFSLPSGHDLPGTRTDKGNTERTQGDWREEEGYNRLTVGGYDFCQIFSAFSAVAELHLFPSAKVILDNAPVIQCLLIKAHSVHQHRLSIQKQRCAQFEGHLGCFQVLAITNNAAMNTVEQMSLLYECASFGYMPKSGIAGSFGRLIPTFLRNLHTDFQSGV
ncbi:zinc finger protein [Cricetulus griseus]|nr:zinc finger protein [Cricetulus griseus]